MVGIIRNERIKKLNQELLFFSFNSGEEKTFPLFSEKDNDCYSMRGKFQKEKEKRNKKIKNNRKKGKPGKKILKKK